MPTLRVEVEPNVDSEFSRYEEYVILYNGHNYIVINRMVLKNIGQENIKSIVIIIPFSSHAIINYSSNSETCNIAEHFQNHSKIICRFDRANEIEPGMEKDLCITYEVKNVNIKTLSNGYQFRLLLYHKGDINEKLDYVPIPKIKKQGLSISFIIPNAFFTPGNRLKAFKFDDSTENGTEVKMLANHKGFQKCFASIDGGNICKRKLENFQKQNFKKWIISSMTSAQLGSLESDIYPASQMRTFKFGFVQKNFLKLAGYEIRFLDIFYIIMALISLYFGICAYFGVKMF